MGWCNNSRLVMLRSKWLPLVTALVVAGAWLVLAFYPKSERDQPELRPRAAPEKVQQALERLAEAPPRPSIDTAPAESAVAEIRRSRFAPEPRAHAAPQITVSGARVGLLQTDTVVVVEPGTDRPPLELPLPGASQIIAIPGGLLAVGKHQLMRLGNGEKSPQLLPRITLFPGSTIFADLIQRDRVWVHHSSMNELYGYGLEPGASALLPIVATVPLAGDSGVFTALPDGSFINQTGSKWERLFAQGKRFELKGPSHSAPPFRALTARRLDQFFVLYRDGLIQRLQIADKLHVVWSQSLGGLPTDIASFGDALVLLRTRRAAGGDLGWYLEVIRPNASSARLQLGVSSAESFRGDWHAHQLFTRGLAASSRFIALGGGDELRVWDSAELRPVPVPAGP